MLGLGLPELIIILVVLLLLFGSTKLPKLARSIGESAGELKKGFDVDTSTTASEKKKSTSTSSAKKKS